MGSHNGRHQPSWWKNSNATSVLMHHRDLAGIRTVGCTNVVRFKFSSLGRVASTTSHFYWLRTGHILLWTRTEVRFCHNWTSRVSFFQWGGSFVGRSRTNSRKIPSLLHQASLRRSSMRTLTTTHTQVRRHHRSLLTY